MQLQSREEDGVVVVDVIGYVSRSVDEESELTEMMHKLLSSGNNLIVVNLDDIQSIDQAAMRMLLQVCTSVHQSGGHMVFVRSIAEGDSEGKPLPDKDKLIFQSESGAIKELKRRNPG
jgi:anti-anti-sigma factor